MTRKNKGAVNWEGSAHIELGRSLNEILTGGGQNFKLVTVWNSEKNLHTELVWVD